MYHWRHLADCFILAAFLTQYDIKSYSTTQSEVAGVKFDTKDIIDQIPAGIDDDKVSATAAFTILALLASAAALAGFFKPIMFTVGHGIAAVCGLIAM